jgi:16S rRNA processing protein RimM
MIADTAELIAIGAIVKPFGVKGEFRVRSLSDVPGRFQGLGRVTLVARSGRALMTTVTRVREDRGFYVLGVEGLSAPEDAAVFRGGWVKIPVDQVPPLPAGHYYEFQLIGMTVKDEEGQSLGTLEEVLETGSNAVFLVRGHGREILVPGTRDVVASVNVDERTMTIRQVAGLVDDHDAL